MTCAQGPQEALRCACVIAGGKVAQRGLSGLDRLLTEAHMPWLRRSGGYGS